MIRGRPTVGIFGPADVVVIGLDNNKATRAIINKACHSSNQYTLREIYPILQVGYVVDKLYARQCENGNIDVRFEEKGIDIELCLTGACIVFWIPRKVD